jgi:von Willebrand factor type A C-terminal domain/von Willebrand factor type A domain
VTDFGVEVFQNEYLPEATREVNAIVTVNATGGPGAAGGGASPAAVVIMIDCSGSMDMPRDKLHAAKQATAVAIDSLRTGVHFAVVAGNHAAAVAYPPTNRLTPATDDTRAAAKRAVSRLYASGGTAIGQWLTLTNWLFNEHPEGIRHAILLTDGRNEGETEADLRASLAACVGRFTADCRGVGTDWSVAELRTISTALLGSVDIVARPADLAADFTAMMAEAMGKAVADVMLRLWTPQGATVRFVKQVAPTVRDLTAMGAPAPAPQSLDYPTGSWGTESRDFHICVEVNPGRVGDEMLAGRISLVSGNEIAGKGLIRALWTDDDALSTRINPAVAHYTGQAELAQVIQEGLQARKDGDADTATTKLGRAVALATESGNDGTAKLLRKVVDVLDPVTGTVRLKARVDDADEMALDTRSTKTIRVSKRGQEG